MVTIKLICFDMDGVIFKSSNFWMKIHDAFGTLEQGKILTKKYLHSDYNKLVKEVVVKLWKGKDAKKYVDLIESVEYIKGVNKLVSFFKEKNLPLAIVSASSLCLAKRAQRDLGFDYIFANELIFKDGKISGEFISTTGVGGKEKVKVLKSLCQKLNILPEEILFIGDSKVDLETFQFVGTSISFNSSCSELNEFATFVVQGGDLCSIIPVLENSQVKFIY